MAEPQPQPPYLRAGFFHAISSIVDSDFDDEFNKYEPTCEGLDHVQPGTRRVSEDWRNQ